MNHSGTIQIIAKDTRHPPSGRNGTKRNSGKHRFTDKGYLQCCPAGTSIECYCIYFRKSRQQFIFRRCSGRNYSHGTAIHWAIRDTRSIEQFHQRLRFNRQPGKAATMQRSFSHHGRHVPMPFPDTGICPIQNCFGCSIGIRASKRKAIRMKYGVSKNTLLITAGIIWLTAGINILRIGVECWINDSHYWLFKACEATLVFLLFFGFIFRKLYRKHTHRISQKKKKNCPFSFFDVQGWIVMAFMITIGILSRLFHLLPESFIAVFYTGLSLALIGTGIRFIIYWWKNKHWLQ